MLGGTPPLPLLMLAHCSHSHTTDTVETLEKPRPRALAIDSLSVLGETGGLRVRAVSPGVADTRDGDVVHTQLQRRDATHEGRRARTPRPVVTSRRCAPRCSLQLVRSRSFSDEGWMDARARPGREQRLSVTEPA
jgi:hypothetical protein